MHPGVRQWFPVAVVAIGLASNGLYAQKGPSLPDVLQAAGDYLVRYSQRLAVIGAEEQYTQYDTSSSNIGVPARLNADFVLVGLGAGGVAGFRDVYAIGGAAMRKRDDRLMTLFTASPASALQQARRLTDDSARAYLSPNLRLLDQPAMALEFLRKENQERSKFTLDSVKTTGGSQVAMLKFTERAAPLVMPSPEDLPATGRFWIDVASGTVRQTEFGFTGKSAKLRVTVTYEADKQLGLWLPVEMYQQVDVYAGASGVMYGMGTGGGYSGHQGLEGRAYYTKYRLVPVDLSTIR